MAGDVMWGDRLPGLSEGGQIRTSHSLISPWLNRILCNLYGWLRRKKKLATFTSGIALSGGDLHQVFFPLCNFTPV